MRAIQVAVFGGPEVLSPSELPDPARALDAVFVRCPRARVELYGKEVRPGRKLGHVTVYGEDLEDVRREARAAVALLGGTPGEQAQDR